VRAPGRQLGTVLFVTHDHDVISKVVTHTSSTSEAGLAWTWEDLRFLVSLHMI
jgi:ATPase subunit of ABC transporter with duplicated ATPase domains